VAATGGLILYLEPLTRLTGQGMERLFAERTARRVTAVLADVVLITVAAQVTTLPIILLLSGQFSLTSLPVNILVAPAQPWIMSLGILAVVAGTVWLPLGQIAAWLVGIPLAYTLSVIRSAAALQGGLPVEISPNAVVVYYLALFGATAVFSQPPAKRQRWIARLRESTSLLSMIGLAVAGLLWAMVISRPDGKLHIWFLPVGEGNAVLIQSPGGAHLLIDGGDNPTRLLTVLSDRLPFFKREIDALLITAPKPVTTDALPPLLARYTVKTVVTNGQRPGAGLADALARTQVVRATAGYRLQASDGLLIEVLNPPAIPDLETDVNDAPLLLRLCYGDASFLLTSDMSSGGVQKVLQSGQYLGATVLQLPSHGGDKANPPAWLKAVSPQVAVIMAEAGNRAAQPSAAVLQQLGNLPVYRTDTDGAIEIATDGQKLWISAGR
jgi:competence protein ComEC